MMRLTITRNGQLGGGTGSGYRYILGMPGKNGEAEQTLDVTNALVSLELKMGAELVNAAQIKFLLDDVDIKADALVALHAHMKDKEVKHQEEMEDARIDHPGSEEG